MLKSENAKLKERHAKAEKFSRHLKQAYEQAKGRWLWTAWSPQFSSLTCIHVWTS